MPLLVRQPKADEFRLFVPEELRKLLLEFTVNYMLDQPSNITEYAFNYFTQLKLRVSEESGLPPKPEAKDESEADFEETIFQSRRRSVFAEPIDPTEEQKPIPQYPKTQLQYDRLLASVEHIFLFRALDAEQIDTVIGAMREKTVKEGEMIINQHEEGDYFYVIEKGIYEVTIKEKGTTKVINRYHNVGSFGELALMYSVPRAASVQALTDGVLWLLDRTTFRIIVLKDAFTKRTTYERFIKQVPILTSLDYYARLKLADALVSMRFSDGMEIFRQGEAADGMYFVERGTVTIVMENKGKLKEVARLGPSSFFGELALLTFKPRAASAIAVGNVIVAFLDLEAFERLLGPCKEIMMNNSESYYTKIRDLSSTESSLWP